MFNIDLNQSYRNPSSSKAAYFPTDMDKSSDPRYYSFVAPNGSWYILRDNQTLGTIRYTKGKSNYTTNWTNRASLTYGYIYEVA